jgi:hypothetical protein
MNGLATLEQIRANGMRPPGWVLMHLDYPVPGEWPQVGPSGEYLPEILISASEPVATADLTACYDLDVLLVSHRDGPRNDALMGRLMACGVRRLEMLRMWQDPADITLEVIDGEWV